MATRLSHNDPFEMAPRAAKPVATHVPVIIGLARILTIKNVLELGAGEYSTPLFLNRRAFPSLISLHSYENNASYAQSVKRMICDDRLKLNIVKGPIHASIVSVIYHLLISYLSTILWPSRF